MIKLRDYQQEAINQTLDWLGNNDGNLVVSLSTGAGKSIIIAEFCRMALQTYEGTKIIMLTHVRELISQNLDKLKTIWPEAPVGVYSAGLGRKEIFQIIYAGVQSIWKKAVEVGHIDLVLVDECHLISHKNEGMYRTFIQDLKEINPKLRVIGLTATPYRMGHGYIHDGSALFDGMIEPVGIELLLKEGYLAPLRSKFTDHHLSTEGVAKRGGEYVEKELQLAVDTDKNNAMVINEMIKYGEDRRSWIAFCTGVTHAEHICELLNLNGISSKVIAGSTNKNERSKMVNDFKAGEIRCLCSVNVVAIGFDAPNVDMIAMIRPTMSAGFYVQMAGRGLRTAEGKENCLVLDFAGNISQHGPITKVRPPAKKGEKVGEAPVKVCENCQEIVHLSCKVCPACGKEFPPPVKEKTRLHQDDIMGIDKRHKLVVTKWRWAKYTSRKTGKTMLRVTYYGGLADVPVKQYFTIYHEGAAGDYARVRLFNLMQKAGVTGADIANAPEDIAKACNKGIPPEHVVYEKNGRFLNVVKVVYNEAR